MKQVPPNVNEQPGTPEDYEPRDPYDGDESNNLVLQRALARVAARDARYEARIAREREQSEKAHARLSAIKARHEANQATKQAKLRSEEARLTALIGKLKADLSNAQTQLVLVKGQLS